MCVRQLCAAQRGTYFAETSVRARAKIADLGAPFIRPGARVLTHGNSRVVLALLRRAVAQVPCSFLAARFLNISCYQWQGAWADDLRWQRRQPRRLCHPGLNSDQLQLQFYWKGRLARPMVFVWKLIACIATILLL